MFHTQLLVQIYISVNVYFKYDPMTLVTVMVRKFIIVCWTQNKFSNISIKKKPITISFIMYNGNTSQTNFWFKFHHFMYIITQLCDLVYVERSPKTINIKSVICVICVLAFLLHLYHHNKKTKLCTYKTLFFSLLFSFFFFLFLSFVFIYFHHINIDNILKHYIYIYIHPCELHLVFII